MPRRAINFTDLGVDPRNFLRDDKPSGNLHQSIGQIFREHQDLLTKKEWASVEHRYSMDKSISATARALKISRVRCRELVARAFAKLMKHADVSHKKSED